MSGSNKKLWTVIGVSAVVGIGIAIYSARLVGDYSTGKVVKGQVKDWEKLWLPARACVVGDDSTFAGAGYAYLYYEATHTRIRERIKRCEPLIRKLKRPGRQSSGVAKVEKSWDNMREATKKLSRAYVAVIDLSTMRPMAERRLQLVEALDGMDAAYTQLRLDSSMSEPKMPGTRHPKELPEGKTIEVDGTPLNTYHLEVDASALQTYGNGGPDGTQTIRVVARGPGKQQVIPQAMVEVAADDTLWGVASHADADDKLELRAGNLGDNGDLENGGVVIWKANKQTEGAQFSFATGKGKTRAVLFARETNDDNNPYVPKRQGLYMVRSTDSGATWSQPVQLAAKPLMEHKSFLQQRIDIAWRDDGGMVQWLIVTSDTLTAMKQPRKLFAADERDSLRLCTFGDTAWFVHKDQDIYRFDAGQGAARPMSWKGKNYAAEMVGCSAEHLLMAAPSDGGMQLSGCDSKICQSYWDVPLADGTSMVYAVGAKNGSISLTQTNDLVLMWRYGETEPGVYLHTEPDAQLRGAIEWDGVVHALVTPKEGGPLRVVPLQ